MILGIVRFPFLECNDVTVNCHNIIHHQICSKQ